MENKHSDKICNDCPLLATCRSSGASAKIKAFTCENYKAALRVTEHKENLQKSMINGKAQIEPFLLRAMPESYSN
jgi:hypothetical protein